MSKEAPQKQEWFNRFRAEWFKGMRPYGNWVPSELEEYVRLEQTEDEDAYWAEGLIRRAPALATVHVQNCRVVPDRYSLIQQFPKGGIVAEVGTLHGDFARRILELASPRELHLIDVEIRPRLLKMVRENAASGVLRFHQADSVRALEQFEDEYFDWIYIDAQHSYDGVRRDIAAAKRKVKCDGWLVFNDYTMWSHREMQPYGVVAAVNEFCLAEDWEIGFLALPSDLYCDVALRKRQDAGRANDRG